MAGIEVFTAGQIRQHVDRLTAGQMFQGMILAKTEETVARLQQEGIFLCRIDDQRLLGAIRSAHAKGQPAIIRSS